MIPLQGPTLSQTEHACYIILQNLVLVYYLLNVLVFAPFLRRKTLSSINVDHKNAHIRSIFLNSHVDLSVDCMAKVDSFNETISIG